MKAGQIMTDQELQDEARRAIEGTTQADVADALGRAPSTISQALSPPAKSRYAGTLREIVEHFTEYRVVTKNAHHIEN